MQQTTAVPEESAPVDVNAKCKIFVGNLSFNTKESDLAKFLEPVGTIVDVNIITFRNRSLGYGFVTFENVEEAQKAVSVKNQCELDGRQVNIETIDESRRGSSRRARSHRPSQPREDSDGAPGQFRARRGGRFMRGGRSNRSESEERQAGEPSETCLFVGNIPWSFNEDSLKDLFAKFNPTSVRIIKRRNGASKGFGFVEFANSKEQQAALESLKEHDVEGRKLLVRVAFGQALQAQSDESAKEN